MIYLRELIKPGPSAVESICLCGLMANERSYRLVQEKGSQTDIHQDSMWRWKAGKSTFSYSASSELFCRIPAESSSLDRPPSVITDFWDEPYRVVQPIKVEYKLGSPSGIIAAFDLANIAAVGQTWLEAFNNLRSEILNTYEDYVQHESNLGPEPARQMHVLREFIKPTEIDANRR